MFHRSDPGPCAACGAAHTACTADQGPISQDLMPAKSAAGRVPPATDTALQAPQGDAAPPLGDGTDGKPFSTATYRGKKKTRP